VPAQDISSKSIGQAASGAPGQAPAVMKHRLAARPRVLTSRASPHIPANSPPPSKPPIPRSAWSRLAACTASAALLQLDGTLITVGLPSVAHSLHISTSSTSVVLSAYFAAYALLLIPGGELVDRFGARRLALAGLALFAVGAAAGALASNFVELIAARVVQGAGAGLVSPAALAAPSRASRRSDAAARSASGAPAPACRTYSARCSAAC
jgi:Major Facilitator Superfamily